MKKIVVANLKMNLVNFFEREQYLSRLEKSISEKKTKNVELVVCPPFIHLEEFKKRKSKKIELGAQNVFWEKKGSFTGEISPEMLRGLDCKYVILGHSERRRYFCERDEEISLKMETALKTGICPVLCVGEKAEEKSISAKIIANQLDGCLSRIKKPKMENVTICYEPVWAISSNSPDHLPTVNEIMTARLIIRKFLVEKYGSKTADKVRIIYGGSVDAKNAKEVCLASGMDGALVGKASLNPREFLKIAEIINQ